MVEQDVPLIRCGQLIKHSNRVGCILEVWRVDVCVREVARDERIAADEQDQAGNQEAEDQGTDLLDRAQAARITQAASQTSGTTTEPAR